jgi:hypothetical protein
MTEKGYELLAAKFRIFNRIDLSTRHPNDVVREITLAVARALWEENPRFQTDQFLKACGL